MSQPDAPTPIPRYPAPSRPLGTPEEFPLAKAAAAVTGLVTLAGGLVLFLTLFLPFVTGDPVWAEIPVDGSSHEVTVEPDRKALLGLPVADGPETRTGSTTPSASCELVDTSHGPVALPAEPFDAGWTGRTDHYATYAFDTGSGSLRITCASPASEDRPVQITPEAAAYGPRVRPDNGLGMMCGVALIIAGLAMTIAMLLAWARARRDQRLFRKDAHSAS